MRFVLVFMMLSGIAHAQSLEAHAGDYVWSGEDSERRAIAAAIQTATASMNTLSANVARMRLAVTNEPAERLSLHFEDSDTVIRFGDTEVRVPNEGSRRTVGPGGERGRASQERTERELKLHFRTVRGARHVTLTFTADGLRMEVRIESPHLDGDVRYTLTYRRA